MKEILLAILCIGLVITTVAIQLIFQFERDTTGWWILKAAFCISCVLPVLLLITSKAEGES